MAEEGKNNVAEEGLPSSLTSPAALLNFLDISTETHDASTEIQQGFITFSRSLSAIREVGRLSVQIAVMHLSAFGTSLILLTQLIQSLPTHKDKSPQQARMIAKSYLLRLCDVIQGGLSSQVKDGWTLCQHLFQTTMECKWWNDYVQQPSHNVASRHHLAKLSAIFQNRIQIRYPKPEDRCLFYKEVFATEQPGTATETEQRAIELLARVKLFDVRAAAVKLIHSITKQDADYLFQPIMDPSAVIADPTVDGGWLRLSLSPENGNCLFFALCAIYGKTLNQLRLDLMSMFDLHFGWSGVRRLSELNSKRKVKTLTVQEKQEQQDIRLSPGYRVTQQVLTLIQLIDGVSIAPATAAGSQAPDPIPTAPEEPVWKIKCRERFNKHVYCLDRFNSNIPGQVQANQFGGRCESLILAHHEDYAKTMLYAVNFGENKPQEEYSIVSVDTTEVAYVALSNKHYFLLVQWNASNGSVQWKFPWKQSPHGSPAIAVVAMNKQWSDRVLLSRDNGILIDVEEEEEKEQESMLDDSGESFEEDVSVGSIGRLKQAVPNDSFGDESAGKSLVNQEEAAEDHSHSEDDSSSESDEGEEESKTAKPRRKRSKRLQNKENNDAEMDESSTMESDVDHTASTASASSANSSRASSRSRRVRGRHDLDGDSLLIRQLLDADRRSEQYYLPLTHRLARPLPYADIVERTVAKYGLAVITPHTLDTLHVGDLAMEAHQLNTIQHPTVMNFGCGNNNGVESNRSTLTKRDVYSNAPLALDLLVFIEQDWTLLNSKGERMKVPLSMRSRRYTKDVSQSIPWKYSQRRSKAAAAVPSSTPQNTAAQPAAAASSSSSSDSSLSTFKQFFPALDDKLFQLLNAFDSKEKKIRENNDQETSSNASSADNESDPQDLESSAKQEARLHYKRMDRLVTWLETYSQGVNAVAKAASKGMLEKCSAFIHPLFFNELRYHRRSLILLAWVHFEGVMDSYLYIKIGFQFFNLHIEQMIFSFIHYQITGESLWFIIPSNQLPRLHRLAAEMYRALYGVKENKEQCLIWGQVLLYSKQLFPPLSLLRHHGIEVRIVKLKANQSIVADGDDAHFGFSTESSKTISVAANNATDRWLKRGLNFLIDHFKWVPKLKESLNRHQQLWTDKQSSETADFHKLKSPNEMASKALNLCPTNFTCSFMHGLRADLLKLVEGKQTLCEYPTIKNDKPLALKYATQCQEVLDLMHAEADWMKEMDLDLPGCRVCNHKADETEEGHTCMQCLCTMPAT